MAFVAVTGSGGIWEYDNAATASDTYSDANGTTASGIRSFTRPSGVTEQIYVKCRKVGETTVRGELSKTYYDNQ
jgi:hypothetical protein